MNDQLPAAIIPLNRLLTAAEYQRLADVPPEIEWFANITNPENAARTNISTVLGDVRPGMAAFDEETFGPAAAITRVADAEEDGGDLF